MQEINGLDLILRALREGLLLVVLVSAPPLLASLLIGFIVGIFQAATQIQDQTMVFVPKLITVILLLIIMGPMLGAQILRFTQTLLLAVSHI